jgi:hypothetical protein
MVGRWHEGMFHAVIKGMGKRKKNTYLINSAVLIEAALAEISL